MIDLFIQYFVPAFFIMTGIMAPLILLMLLNILSDAMKLSIAFYKDWRRQLTLKELTKHHWTVTDIKMCPNSEYIKITSSHEKKVLDVKATVDIKYLEETIKDERKKRNDVKKGINSKLSSPKGRGGWTTIL